MKFKKIDEKYFIRFERGEEVVETLKKLCKDEGITFASVSAIGATESLTVGLFDPIAKKYISHDLTGPFEITNLTGNVSEMNEDVYLHLHITVSDVDNIAKGGHLNKAIINPTCEMILDTGAGRVDRFMDPETGLNLLKL
ncbi:MAG: DNA-binding protein [Clostridiaceae bacterium]